MSGRESPSSRAASDLERARSVVRDPESIARLMAEVRRETRHEALEDCAKMAESALPPFDSGSYIAECIRQMMPSLSSSQTGDYDG